MDIEGLGAVDDNGGELGVELFKDGFAEASADVTDAFVSVGCSIVASQEEGAVDRGAFAFAVVGA